MTDEVVILESFEQLWSPDGKGSPWGLRITYGLRGTRPGVVAVELYAVDPAKIQEVADGWPDFDDMKERPSTRFITTAGLRVPLAEMMNRDLASTKRRAGAMRDQDLPEHLRSYKQRVSEARPPRRPGRPPSLTRRHFEEVASIYNKAFAKGASPLEAVANAKHVSRSTAGKWATTCRRLGLLPPTAQGKAAGFPVTKRARKR